MKNQTQITGAEAILLALLKGNTDAVFSNPDKYLYQNRKKIIGIPERIANKRICERIINNNVKFLI
jgi:hypothetical protein